MDKLYAHLKTGTMYEPKGFPKPQSRKSDPGQNRYWAFLPAPLPPTLDWSMQLVNALSDAERELSKLATLAANHPFPRSLTQPFMRREAVLSSRIEGMRASLVDLYEFESSQLPFLEAGNDASEVLNQQYPG